MIANGRIRDDKTPRPTCLFAAIALLNTVLSPAGMAEADVNQPRQQTTAPHGHILTNIGVWSPDSRWIVYDVRSDAAGERFDGTHIERVEVDRGRVERLYTSSRGAACGVVTTNPRNGEVVFIHGPEQPTADWQYAAYHRRGVVLDPARPDRIRNLDARDVVPPFTVGALRGGTHVHTFSGDGLWVAFTYEDHLLATAALAGPSGEIARGGEGNQRNVGVSVPIRPVQVPRTHPRNHDGSCFSVLVTRTWDDPRPDTDEISRAMSDAWVGTAGYVRGDGSRQQRAIAFQGVVRSRTAGDIAEVFIVDLPGDVTQEADREPLCGTPTTRPRPPQGTRQRRLTFTSARKYPGIQGPRHWLRSSPDGSRIAFLMKDESGVVQIWTVSPAGGSLHQLTANRHDISSAFSWSADGRFLAHTLDASVCVTDADTGETRALTSSEPGAFAPRPEACVVSPDATKIAFVKPVPHSDGHVYNQVFVVDVTAKSE